MSLTKDNMSKYVGKIAVFSVNKMVFNVKIIDCRITYSQPELKIEPSSGKGSAWIRNFNKIGIIN